MKLLDGQTICWGRLEEFACPPEVFAPGEAQFWTDPYISQQMLAVHLDPSVDAASRRPHVIEQTVRWLMDHLQLSPGSRVLDLGCGPGLYATRLAQNGMQITAIDFSSTAVEYARQEARRLGLSIDYRVQDYLTIEFDSCFDLIVLIYGDFCVLDPKSRDELLRRVRRALAPGGVFVFDLTTPTHRVRHGLKESWSVQEGGFWNQGPHLVLERGFSYPDAIHLDQYLVLGEDGSAVLYRNWFQDYIPQTIRGVLEKQGMRIISLWGDLQGSEYVEESEWLGVVAGRDLTDIGEDSKEKS